MCALNALGASFWHVIKSYMYARSKFLRQWFGRLPNASVTYVPKNMNETHVLFLLRAYSGR